METTFSNELRNNKTIPCISIIVPTHRTSPERTVDPLEIKKAVENAKKLLGAKYGGNGVDTSKVLGLLDELTMNIDYLHNSEGIGLFVSPSISQIVKFPFPVKERIIIGDSFEIRDVLYLENSMRSFYVLSITEKDLRLFRGNGEVLQEIHDKNFPVHIVEEYEYARPNIANSYGFGLKNTEKDKSIVEEERLIAEMKKADKKLGEYLKEDKPLLINGVTKELGYFMKISTHKKNIKGKVLGNYSYADSSELGKLAYEEIKSFLDAEENKTLERLSEAVGRKLAASGIEEVWKAANEGKGLLLLVEKDCVAPGFLSSDHSTLHTHPPKTEHEIVTDAVDDVMETVLEKNGQVLIVENGKLFEHNGIALILRYS
jgi:hypothetical protein